MSEHVIRKCDHYGTIKGVKHYAVTIEETGPACACLHADRPPSEIESDCNMLAFSINADLSGRAVRNLVRAIKRAVSKPGANVDD